MSSDEGKVGGEWVAFLASAVTLCSVADPELLATGGKLRGHREVGSGREPCPLSENVFEFQK